MPGNLPDDDNNDDDDFFMMTQDLLGGFFPLKEVKLAPQCNGWLEKILGKLVARECTQISAKGLLGGLLSVLMAGIATESAYGHTSR